MGVSEAGFAKLSSRRTPMQVFGLPRQIIRSGREGGRLLVAKAPDTKCGERATRWHAGAGRWPTG